jgi:hypothetical protein
VMAQRLRPRLGLASRGSFCNATVAASRSSAELFGLRIVSLSLSRLAAYFFAVSVRRFSRSTMLVFAICLLTPLLAEGELEGFEQRPTRLVVLRRGGDSDVHTPKLVDLVVLDFGENDLFLDAHVVVAASIKGTR